MESYVTEVMARDPCPAEPVRPPCKMTLSGFKRWKIGKRKSICNFFLRGGGGGGGGVGGGQKQNI